MKTRSVRKRLLPQRLDGDGVVSVNYNHPCSRGSRGVASSSTTESWPIGTPFAGSAVCLVCSLDWAAATYPVKYIVLSSVWLSFISPRRRLERVVVLEGYNWLGV